MVSLLCASRWGKSLRWRNAARSGRLRPSQGRDVDLAHLQHRAHDPLRRFGISVHQHLGQRSREDLPREAELVLEPAAVALFTVLCQRAPEVVDLLLRFTGHLERHRLVELEMRAAVERQEVLPFDFELHGHHRSRLLAVNLEALFAIAADLSDFGILEDGSIKFCRLFGLRIEPQAGRDLFCRELHDLLLSRPFRLASTRDGIHLRLALVPGFPLEFTPAKAGAGMNGVWLCVGVSGLELSRYRAGSPLFSIRFRLPSDPLGTPGNSIDTIR